MRNALFFLVTLTCNLFAGELCNAVTKEFVELKNSCTLSPSPSSLAAVCCAEQPHKLRITKISDWIAAASIVSVCCSCACVMCVGCVQAPIPACCTAVGFACPFACSTNPDYPAMVPKKITCRLPVCCPQRKPQKSPIMEL